MSCCRLFYCAKILPYSLVIGYNFCNFVNLKIIFVISGVNDFWKKNYACFNISRINLHKQFGAVAVRTTLTNPISAWLPCTGRASIHSSTQHTSRHAQVTYLIGTNTNAWMEGENTHFVWCRLVARARHNSEQATGAPGQASVLTVLVGDLNVDEEEVEAPGVGSDELGERPVEGGAAADGGVRVPLERRLVHRHHHSRRRRRVRHCTGAPPSLARSGCLPRQEEKFWGKFWADDKRQAQAQLFLSSFTSADVIIPSFC